MVNETTDKPADAADAADGSPLPTLQHIDATSRAAMNHAAEATQNATDALALSNVATARIDQVVETIAGHEDLIADLKTGVAKLNAWIAAAEARAVPAIAEKTSAFLTEMRADIEKLKTRVHW